MIFIQRDEAGQVRGVYARRQPGYAEEEVADNHPDVIAFRRPRPAPVTMRELIAALERKGVLTAADVEAERGR